MTVGDLRSKRFTDQTYTPRSRGYKSYKAGDDLGNSEDAGAFLKQSSLTSGKSEFEVFIGQAYDATLGNWIDLPADEGDLQEYMDMLGGGGDVIIATSNFPRGLDVIADSFDIIGLNDAVDKIVNQYGVVEAQVAATHYLDAEYLIEALKGGKVRDLKYEDQAYDEYFLENYTLQKIVDFGLDSLSTEGIHLEMANDSRYGLKEIVEKNGRWYALY